MYTNGSETFPVNVFSLVFVAFPLLVRMPYYISIYTHFSKFEFVLGLNT